MPLWFVAAFVPMIASQILRLYQHDATWWLAFDYIGRISALAVLAAHPSARAIALKLPVRTVDWFQVAVWTTILAAFPFAIGHPIMHAIDSVLPATALGDSPDPGGWLRILDMTGGLALVALHEEILFRRCARAVFGRRLGDGWGMIGAAAILFGAYHWWTGLGNIAYATLFGALAMVALKRIGILWPIIVAHYAIDLITFYI